MNQTEKKLMEELFIVHIIEGENSDDVGELFIERLDIENPDLLNEIVIDELERKTFPDEINWNDLDYEYTVDFPYIKWEEEFLELAYNDILKIYQTVTEDTIGDYFIKKEFLHILIANVSNMKIDVTFSRDLIEYLDRNPDVSHMEMKFEKDVDVERVLTDYLLENEKELDELVKQNMLEEGYPEYATSDMVGMMYNVLFSSDFKLLAESFIESEYMDSYINVNEFLSKELGKFLFENKNLFTISFMYELEPHELISEL